ncbi:unnamed protein product [Coffea canephora]|uniref:Protein transport protein Sec61 subunit beta n=3 Tax=Coffea TaxID=13442 RepID=A0A068ULY8_COFCA|nr:protein transport protein Sec61 subunit beta-like [Coffea arabica]CDP09481.1 unnamed protein product [Coffea canephora]
MYTHVKLYSCAQFQSTESGIISDQKTLKSTASSSSTLFFSGNSPEAEMALGGAAPQRGTAAAAAANTRRRRPSSSGAAGGAGGTMLQFYTDDAPGLKISPNVVLVMSIGFIAFVAILHVMGKLYFVRREA